MKKFPLRFIILSIIGVCAAFYVRAIWNASTAPMENSDDAAPSSARQESERRTPSSVARGPRDGKDGTTISEKSLDFMPSPSASPSESPRLGALKPPSEIPTHQTVAARTLAFERAFRGEGFTAPVSIEEVKKQLLKHAGPGFEHESGSFRFLDSVWAVPESEYSVKPGQEVLAHRIGFVFIRGAAELPDSPNAHPVVMHTQSGSLGFASGLISVALRQNTTAHRLAADHHLALVQLFDDIRTAHLQSDAKQPGKLLGILENLRNDERVASANIVVTDRRDSPR